MFYRRLAIISTAAMISIISAACGNSDNPAGVQDDTYVSDAGEITETESTAIQDDKGDEAVPTGSTSMNSIQAWSEYEVLVDLAMKRGFGENFKVALEPEKKKMYIKQNSVQKEKD